MQIAVRDLQNGISIPNGLGGLNAVLSLCKADTQSAIASRMSNHWQRLKFLE
jgi:hypothetical protein